MIVFYRPWLLSLGMTPNEVAEIRDGGGLATVADLSLSRLDTDIVAPEPEPRSLTLVGLSDRYGKDAKRTASIIELCTSLPAQVRPRDAVTICEALAQVNNPAAKIITALVVQAGLC